MKAFYYIPLTFVFAVYSCNCLSIYDQLRALNATTFLSVLNKTGLVQQLSSPGPWTVLVPTDAAFAKIPASDLSAVINNVNMLTEVLKYHIVSGKHYTSEFLFIKHYFLNSTNGHVLRVHRNQHGMYFNQAKAVSSNINATNGVIFLIDEVLDVPEGTITDILANPGYNVSQFLQLVKLTHLDRQYSKPAGLNRYTVFAPSDTAFNAIPATVKSKLLQDDIYAQNGSIKLNNVAQLLLPDIEAENGVVHVIDHALIPPPESGIVG